MSKVSIRVLPWGQWLGFASTWERLHSLSDDASFFLSREWVDCWLTTFGEQLQPELMVFETDGMCVGCCLLVWRTAWVRGIPLRRVYLNCAGEDEADSTCIEYNSLLSLPEYAEQVANTLGKFLRKRYWDELHLPGVADQSFLRTIAGSLGTNEISIQPCYYVDLGRLRSGGKDYDAVLSSNTRQQIRRSRRLYEESIGPCVLRTADTASEAIDAFTQLADLHQVAWQHRGKPGVFSSQRFTCFHRDLIQRTFDAKHVLLVEMLAGTEVIASLYSFLYRGRIYFYQSGFRYTNDARLKPGLLSHYLAVDYCLRKPTIVEYDFLAGDSQYKRSLGTDSRKLLWVVVHRSTLSSLLFRGLRSIKRAYGEILKKSRQEN